MSGKNWRFEVFKALCAATNPKKINKISLLGKEKALYKASFQYLVLAETLCEKWLKKPIKEADFKICFAMAMAEIEEMRDVQPHAVLFETVELLKQNKKTAHLSSTLNAFLRRYLEEKPVNSLKIPKWIFTKISKQYKNANLIAEHIFDEPALDIRPRRDLSFSGELLSNGALRLKNQQPEFLAGFDEGDFYVQDEAAQLPGFVFSLIAKKSQIETGLDICCAPGGKLFHFMDVTPSVLFTGADINPTRMARVIENAKRLQLSPKVIEADLFDLKGSYDFVSLDAPCSATGTSRRHPEVLFRQTALDVFELCKLQEKALIKSASLVKEAGYLLYSTCSLFKDESENQISTFLKNAPNFKLIDLNKYPELAKYTSAEGYLRTTPDMGADGFFVALLQKSS